jgi:Family of unknown function (DUF6527)
MGKIMELIPVFIESLPEHKDLEEGKLYISRKYGMSNHLCACGCKEETPMGFKPLWNDDWELTEHPDGSVSFTPSIGNFIGQKPYHAHYYIKMNKIVWC